MVIGKERVRTRRAFLAASAGVAAIAGCTTYGNPGGSNQNQTVVAEQSTQWVQSDGTFGVRPEIPRGDWRFWWVELTRSGRLEFEFVVQEGGTEDGEVEVFVVDTDNYEDYENGNLFEPLVHRAGTSGSASVDLPADQRFYLVADNALGGEVYPFDGETARVEITGQIS